MQVKSGANNQRDVLARRLLAILKFQILILLYMSHFRLYPSIWILTYSRQK